MATISISTLGDVTDIPLAYGELKGYFDEERVTLQKTDLSHGRETLRGVLNGSLDVGLVSSYVYVEALLNDSDFTDIVVLGSYAVSASAIDLLVSSQADIQTPWKMQGAVIGVLKGSQIEYYLHQLLGYYKIPEEEVAILHIPYSELKVCLDSGKVDMVLAPEPYSSHLVSTGMASVLPVENITKAKMLLVTSRYFYNERRALLKRFIKAFIKTNRDLGEAEAGTIDILEKISGLDKTRIQKLISTTSLKYTLDKTVIVSMEKQARWMIQRGLSKKQTVPDFIQYAGIEVFKEVSRE